MGVSNSNGSIDRSKTALRAWRSFSDRRLGVDWGNPGSACLSASMVIRSINDRVPIFWIYGTGTQGDVQPSPMKETCRGDALARSRVNIVNSLLRFDIRVQLAGSDVMQLRQYRHTWVNGTISLVSTAASSCRQR